MPQYGPLLAKVGTSAGALSCRQWLPGFHFHRHPEAIAGAAGFDAHHPGVAYCGNAARLSHFAGQREHQLQHAPLEGTKIGIEEHAGSADVPGDSRKPALLTVSPGDSGYGGLYAESWGCIRVHAAMISPRGSRREITEGQSHCPVGRVRLDTRESASHRLP